MLKIQQKMFTLGEKELVLRKTMKGDVSPLQ